MYTDICFFQNKIKKFAYAYDFIIGPSYVYFMCWVKTTIHPLILFAFYVREKDGLKENLQKQRKKKFFHLNEKMGMAKSLNIKKNSLNNQKKRTHWILFLTPFKQFS